MRRLYFAAVFSVLFSALVTGCASNSPPASGPAGSQPPRLTVGTSYPDTQLILPWFLNDVINFVNYR